MASKQAVLPPSPSPFARRRSHDPQEYYEDDSGRQAGRRMISGLSKTAGKAFASTPDVGDDEPMHRSVIEELVGLDAPPTKTEHLINTKRTFEELQIRRSNSFDRERIELSLSSDYVDYQSENTQLRRKIEELEQVLHDTRIRAAAQSAEDRAAAQKWRLIAEQKERQVQNAEAQCNTARLLITEYQSVIGIKENWISEYKAQLEQAKDKLQQQEQMIRETNRNLLSYQERFQAERQALIQQCRDTIATYEEELDRNRSQLKMVNEEFASAKVVGQNQINQLLQTIRKLENQNAFLRNTVNQGLFLNNSMHHSESITASNAIQSDQKDQREKYMARFRNFSRMIDRKLFSSCDDKESNIFYSKVATNSAIQQGKREGRFQHLGHIHNAQSTKHHRTRQHQPQPQPQSKHQNYQLSVK